MDYPFVAGSVRACRTGCIALCLLQRRPSPIQQKRTGVQIQHINSGALRALAVTTATRSPQLPDVPSLVETVPGYEASALFGMGAPKKTPAEIIEKLNHEINAVLAEPEMKKRLVELGGEPLISTPEAFGAMIAAETEKWEKVVKLSGARVE